MKDHLVHKTRSSNLIDYEQAAKPRINFPKSGDTSTWKEVDKELSVLLPEIFNIHLINSAICTSKLSKKFDDWLHDFFLKRFGSISKQNSTPRSKKEFRHRGLERLRQKKRLLTKAFKALKKADLADSPLGKLAVVEWKKILKMHNSLRRSVFKAKKKKAEVAATREFKKDPNVFASKLFSKSSNGKPTFSKDQATEYFSKTYRDEGREEHFVPQDSFTRPPPPKVIFEERCPSLRELQISVRKKANKAAAGLNALSYVPYKKCPSILLTLHRIIQKIWISRDIPEDWGKAFIVLLSKDPEKLDVPSEFRPIAITNSVGKIFFSVISDRLQKFLVQNNFIRRETQKGFLFGLPGCLEHSFTLFEALRDAKINQRQMIVAWIDLANAYGSVRHNLIQFALNWYHVPDNIQKLIFDYYDKLMAKIQTSDWSTGFFLFDIGLFQGCVLSTILFDAVFQLLLDLLKPVNEELGYAFKSIDYKNLSRAYADDLALSASTPENMQHACDICDEFLTWTITMKAKPRKCITVGYRQFDKRTDSGKYMKLKNVKYAPFDPGIFIGGKRMRSIIDLTKSDDASVTLLRDHFKFLGRWISIELNEHKIQTFLSARFLEKVEKVNRSNVSGFMKLWLYQNYLLSQLAWPFLIYDLPLSFAKSLESTLSMKLKSWAHLYRGAEIGALFRSRKLFGLGLSSISHHFCKMQLIKCSLLEKSCDPKVRAVYEHKFNKTSKWTVKWDVRKIYKSYSADVILQTQFPTQCTRLGLGNDVFNGNPSNADVRKLLTKTADDVEEHKFLAHSVQLERQGNWIAWYEQVNVFDFSWSNLIYGPGDSLISFVLNATINTCRTPSLLKLWGYHTKAECPLCKGDNCTLHHILANCKTALNQRRYNWRHDSVLIELRTTIESLCLHHVKKKSKPSNKIEFVKKNHFSKDKRKCIDRSTSLLDGAKDWELLVDLDDNRSLFPPEVYATAERPDILIFSRTEHRIILCELTCGAEEGFVNAVLRKEGRYAPLVAKINDDKANPWSAQLFTIEVGARGFVGYSLTSFLRKLGFSSRKTRSTCKRISLIAAKCSYGIYLMHTNHNWDAKRPLLELPPKELDCRSKAP